MADYSLLLKRFNLLVLVIFIAEITIKLAAHGRRPWHYFRDGWNVFDFANVALCCLPMDSHFAAVLRLARGLQLLRLVTALPRLQLLVGALLKSVGAMGYVTLLLALLFYIYGVAGVHLFGGHDARHFGSLGAALMSLFRMITLDNWSDLFNAARASAPMAAALYFVSFILLGTMIMLNLFIGIIMNSMSEMHAEIEARDRARHVKELAFPVETEEEWGSRALVYEDGTSQGYYFIDRSFRKFTLNYQTMTLAMYNSLRNFLLARRGEYEFFYWNNPQTGETDIKVRLAPNGFKHRFVTANVHEATVVIQTVT